MPSLFGLDIAGLVASSLGGHLLPATLTVVTAGARGSDPTAGTNPTQVSHACRGVLEDYATRTIDGTMVRVGDRRALLLGGTLPAGVVPKPGDTVTIEGATFNVVRVERDPAGAAYVCQLRGL